MPAAVRRLAVMGTVPAIVAAWLALAAQALADSPAPTQAAIGDPRAGQSAGFVGDPGLAIVIVAAIAVASVAVTLLWVRATGGPVDPADPD